MKAVRVEWAAPLAVGVLAGLVTWLAFRLPPPTSSDIDQTLAGARALLSGQNPYLEAGRKAFPFPLYYPMPALLVLGPVALLPLELARATWAAVSGALFTHAALRYRRGLLTALLSASFLTAIVEGQWSPLLTAAAVLPWLGFAWVAKPTIGAALFAAYPSRRALVGCVLVLVVSLIVAPSWPLPWYAAIQDARHVGAPILKPGGFLLALSLLRWRQPEARLLAVLACVPQTTGLYEALLLFLIPRDRWEGYGLAVLGYVAAFAQVLLHPRLPGMNLEELLVQRWPYILTGCYLPALVLVLRRPNRSSLSPA